MRRCLVAGNWKMNGTLESIDKLLDGILEGAGSVTAADILVCSPFVYLQELQRRLAGSPIKWGAQTVSEHESGAYTGEVSVSMLKDFGCTHVIVGHSERRAIYGESDQAVAEKFAAALSAGLTPILCVGEMLEERESGVTEEVVGRQLDAVIALTGAQSLADAVVAYEPVWAIGTGKTATPEQAQDVHAFIRSRVRGHDAATADGLQILYGGSVKGSNAGELFGMSDIDGGLIGGASLNADDFLTICQSAR